MAVDKRKRLEAMRFDYRVAKNNKVFVRFDRRIVLTLVGRKASKFLRAIEAADDALSEQLVMARITGNFKHGNERKGGTIR